MHRFAEQFRLFSDFVLQSENAGYIKGFNILHYIVGVLDNHPATAAKYNKRVKKSRYFKVSAISYGAKNIGNMLRGAQKNGKCVKIICLLASLNSFNNGLKNRHNSVAIFHKTPEIGPEVISEFS